MSAMEPAPATTPQPLNYADPQVRSRAQRDHVDGFAFVLAGTQVVVALLWLIPTALTPPRGHYELKNPRGYETWSAELTEVITFGWSVDPPSRLTMLGREYVFRDEAKHVRREPCDWHFPNVPFDISVEPVAAGGAMPLLRLHFPLGRVDTYGLVTPDLTGYEDFHFA